MIVNTVSTYKDFSHFVNLNTVLDFRITINNYFVYIFNTDYLINMDIILLCIEKGLPAILNPAAKWEMEDGVSVWRQ